MEYFCERCDYRCSRKFLWDQHLATRKHQMETNGNHYTDLQTGTAQQHVCPDCGRGYKYRSGLWKHRQKCDQKPAGKSHELQPEQQDSDMKKLMQEVVQGLQRDAEVKNEMLRQLREQQAIIKDMVPRIGSNNNTQFNINLFLNEQCRDAINMTEFLASLNIQVPDLLYTRDNGLAEGISSVFVSHLRRLDMSKRPIHCTDAKRETLYIKDNDEWERDLDNVRLRTAINDVAIKQRKAISDWEKDHPDWNLSETGREEYLMLVKSVMEDANESSSENRIIRCIAKETTIDATNRKN